MKIIQNLYSKGVRPSMRRWIENWNWEHMKIKKKMIWQITQVGHKRAPLGTCLKSCFFQFFNPTAQNETFTSLGHAAKKYALCRAVTLSRAKSRIFPLMKSRTRAPLWIITAHLGGKFVWESEIWACATKVDLTAMKSKALKMKFVLSIFEDERCLTIEH